jgi:diaminopimelate decarboxylase
MNHFRYIDGQLCAEDVRLERLAAEVGTPFYCYSTATLERHFRIFRDALAGLDVTVCFAVKANPNIAVIRTLARLGAGADVVSEGELRRALAAGVPPGRIVFSGVGKTRRELEAAVDLGILQINVESEGELEELNEVAVAMRRRAVIGLRVNPDVDAHTHAKITTGRKENKFGVEWTRAHGVLRLASRMPGLKVAGVAMHIGSQLTDLQPFRDAFARMHDLVVMLRANGIPLERIDLGGGLGVPYQAGNERPPSPDEYAALVRRHLGDLGCALVLEPGRVLVGNAGLLISRILYVKEGATRTFLICDAGMNDLVRPAMYDAYHEILPLSEPAADSPRRPVDVVGPVCESGDTFARHRLLPPLAKDDLIAFATAGAYGAAMASTYNSRPLVPEVLVNGDAFAVVRRRPTYEEMLGQESLPEWLE